MFRLFRASGYSDYLSDLTGLPRGGLRVDSHNRIPQFDLLYYR